MTIPRVFPALLLACIATGLPIGSSLADEPAGLQRLRLALAEAMVDYGQAMRRCQPDTPLSQNTLARLQALDLPRERLLRAVGWLALERQRACEAPQRQALAEALIRLRTALVANGREPREVDELMQILWADSLRLATLEAEFEALSSAVRKQLRNLPELQKPFDARPLYEVLAPEPPTR